MQNSLKKFSPAAFAVAVVCFILPWVNLSCEGQRVATFTGLQLVTGTAVQQQDMFSQRLNQTRAQELQRKVQHGEMTQEQADRQANEPSRVGSEPLAVAVLLSTVLGLALSFLRGGKSAIIPAVVGLAASILLLLLKSKIATDAIDQSEGMVHAEFAIGFWVVLILSLGAAALNGFLYLSSRGQVQATKP
jgi:hypothetical protein